MIGLKPRLKGSTIDLIECANLPLLYHLIAIKKNSMIFAYRRDTASCMRCVGYNTECNSVRGNTSAIREIAFGISVRSSSWLRTA